MGIFDIFTGDPAKEAAAKTRDYLSGVQTRGAADLSAGYDAAGNAIRTGTTGALSALGSGYTGATGAINTGFDNAGNYLDQGRLDAMGQLGLARGVYDPLLSKYSGATSLALGALGAGGAGGTDAARAAFTAGPGYQFNLDQGLDAINRRRAAGGMLASGNADRDAQAFGAGLASQEYDKWLSNLLGFTQPELTAAGGVAGTYGKGADVASQFGTAQAGLASERGRMLADLSSRYGGDQANLLTGQGQSLAGLATGGAQARTNLATNLAQPYASTYGNEAQAEMAGSGQLWNSILGLTGLGTSLYGINKGNPISLKTGA